MCRLLFFFFFGNFIFFLKKEEEHLELYVGTCLNIFIPRTRGTHAVAHIARIMITHTHTVLIIASTSLPPTRIETSFFFV